MNFKDKLRDLVSVPDSIELVDVPDSSDFKPPIVKDVDFKPIKRGDIHRPTIDKVFGDVRKFYPRRMAYRSAKATETTSAKLIKQRIVDWCCGTKPKSKYKQTALEIDFDIEQGVPSTIEKEAEIRKCAVVDVSDGQCIMMKAYDYNPTEHQRMLDMFFELVALNGERDRKEMIEDTYGIYF